MPSVEKVRSHRVEAPDGLASGLRALEVLAAHAPLELRAFAALSRLSIGEAVAFLSAFEQTGYVARVDATQVNGDALFVLTPLALDLVPYANAAARLN